MSGGLKGMLCEMCGTEVPTALPIVIDGAELSVCPRCSRFGTRQSEEERSPPRTRVSEALERRRRRMRVRDIYAGEGDALAADYPARIRAARTSRGLKQAELARDIKEKLSVVSKLERGELRPDDALVVKLERALDIQLRESADKARHPTRTSSSKGLTIGDILQRGEG